MIKWTKQDADMAGSRKAILRAARRACEAARMHGLPVAVLKDNRVVEIPPDQLKFSSDLDTEESRPIERRRR